MTTLSAPEVLVIGAGPYGLSIGAHLLGRGVDVRVVGKPMASWIDQMPVGMVLKSEGFASSLSDPAGRSSLPEYAKQHGAPYRDTGLPIPLDTFSEYGLWFQRERVPIVEDTEVVDLRHDHAGFTVRLATGELVRPSQVVVAVGTTFFKYVPSTFAGLSDEHVSHPSQHRDLSVFRGQDVTIIGAGQSALESAALLHEHGAEVHVLVRAGELAWNDDPGPEETSRLDRLRCPTAPLCGCGWKCLFYSYGAGAFHYLPHRTRVATVKQTFGPAGAWWLKPRVLGQVDIHLQTTVTRAGAKNGRVALEVDDAMTGRTHFETDHVLAATGYHVNVDAIGFLDRDLRASVRTIDGVPKLSRSFESSIPGLYFVGLAAAHEFGPAMRFVYGADFAARRVVKRLARVTPRSEATAPTTDSTAPAAPSA